VVCSYDPERDAWWLVASMGSARLGVGVCEVNRLLYAVGGFDGVRRLASAECYHPENNCWTPLPPMAVARSGAGNHYTLSSPESMLGSRLVLVWRIWWSLLRNSNRFLPGFTLTTSSSSSYPYPSKWGRYNMFSSCCDKDSAFIFTTGCLPDVNPP
jgi:hypothetical protein